MKAPQLALALSQLGCINAQQSVRDTMNLDTDSSWGKGDLVALICVCSCSSTAVWSKVKGALPWVGGCPSQEAEKVRSALQSQKKLVLSEVGPFCWQACSEVLL